MLGKLSDGISFEKILDQIRDNPEESLNRVDLLTRQDLRNISRDFHINRHERLHENDSVSVDLWVQKMRELGDDCPVLFYKPQGSEHAVLCKEDFVLVLMTSAQRELLEKFGNRIICIDSTHGTNAYDFQLTTVVVVDEFGSGMPVSYCISNKVNKTSMKVFFHTVKEKVSIIKVNAFMSDDAPTYYNAWKEVMGDAEMQLLCAWHVDRNWRSNLTKITGGKEKRALVYKTLRVLLEEPDVLKFEALLVKCIEDLLNDPETNQFGKYFEQVYSRRPKCWAYCYRKHAGINTNMYLESMHKLLKYVYFEGKKVKRLDFCIHSLMHLTRDKLFDRIIKFSKGVHSTKVHSIQERHTSSKTVSHIQVIQDGVWKVTSRTNKHESYRVERNNESCPSECRHM